MNEDNRRLTILAVVFLLAALVIIAKLFVLQIIQGSYYSTLALSSHEIYKKIHPTRGEIFFKSVKDGSEAPAAVNAKEYLLYAVPKAIEKEKVADVVSKISAVLNWTPEDQKINTDKLNKENDPYEPLAKKISEEQMEQIKNLNLPGVNFTPLDRRFYPENNLASTVLGFYGFDSDGNSKGSYGLEGYEEPDLAGKSGIMLGERGAKGGWITLAGRTTTEATNGADLVLTIDRGLEYEACERLRQGIEEYKAKSASLIMMDPKTGAVLAMCSLPDFDPNNYSKAGDVRDYNNTSIFTSYEPGSVFKPITMSMGLDLNLITPNTTFNDPGILELNGHKIHNALDKSYGTATMTEVLENSINTGAVWVEEKVGPDRFKKYVEKYGFGQKTGIELDTEAAGDIRSLANKGDVWGATASFGQGIMVTPIQLAVAYSAIANGGQLFKPYIISEKRWDNGKIERTEPEMIDQIFSERAAKLLTGMLVSDVENGHSKGSRLPDYYLAGKTGTAQIAGNGGYLEVGTNHTFAGFGPASDPKVVLIVKFEQPQMNPLRDYADYTAGPVFRDVMKFTLNYLGAPKDK